jgi:hypothetical protein
LRLSAQERVFAANPPYHGARDIAGRTDDPAK